MPNYGQMLGEQLGTQAAGGILGGMMDMAMQPWRNQNQLNQNQKLMEQQIKGQKEMGLFNVETQMDLWNRTNAAAQLEHYKKAGLSPALMYSGGGGGGSTGAAPGNVTGGGADARAGGGYTGMNIQTAAQIELMRSQARNLDADTTKKLGVDTQLGQTTIEKLKAETSNTKVQTALTRIQKDILEITQEDITDQASLTSQRMQQELFQIKNQTDISDATKETIIKTVGQEYMNKVIQAMAMKSGIQVNQAQIQKMGAEVLQGWQQLSLEERKTIVQENLGGEQKDQDQWINVFNNVSNAMKDIFLFKQLKGLTPIKGGW